MSEIRPRRSLLAMPGSNARAIEKAATLPADAILLDLEDGVTPEMAGGGEGRGLGFDGKMVIHPSQIAPANAAFGPDAGEVGQARRVIEAFGRPENRARGVIALDGRMVERRHVDAARRTLARAEAIEELHA